MEIYIVSHFQDNGESYEDKQTWTNRWLFSIWRKAYAFYCNQILDEYKGVYKLLKVSLDTYKELEDTVEVLEESPWGGYTCFEPEYVFPGEPEIYCDGVENDDFDYYEEPEYPEYEEEWNDYYYNYIAEQEALYEERRIENEWLTHKGENYQIFEEIRKCEENKLTIELLKDLISLL